MRQMLRSPYESLRNKLVCHFVHCQRFLNKPGIVVAVLGLDGSGKSTLVELMKNDIERLFHAAVEHRHLRPGFLPQLATLARRDIGQAMRLANPHVKPPSGAIVSIIRLAYYTIDYFLGYWVCVYPVLVKFPTVFFFDRYFYDYYIDPARLRVSAPWWMVELFAFFVPEPDLTIMIRPHPEVFHKRKPELPLEELRQQSERVYILAKKLKNVTWIDTSCKIEITREEMMRAVLETFEGQLRWRRIIDFSASVARATGHPH
jgi:thymidylate kinase